MLYIYWRQSRTGFTSVKQLSYTLNSTSKRSLLDVNTIFERYFTTFYGLDCNVHLFIRTSSYVCTQIWHFKIQNAMLCHVLYLLETGQVNMAWSLGKIHLVERNTLHRAFNGNDRFLARSPWMDVWQGLWVSQMDCWGESSEVWGGWLGWCRWASIYCSQWGSPVGLLCLSKNPSYTHTFSEVLR